MLTGISEKRPDIKIVIVDTISAIENDMEMRDAKKPGFNKWTDFALDIYELYTVASKLRDDLIIVFCAHVEPYEENGVTMYRTKHGGQKLTKLNPNSRVAYNLFTDLKVGSDGTRTYQFITQTDGTTEAGSVEGVLPLVMPNDLGEVIYRIRKYDLGISE